MQVKHVHSVTTAVLFGSLCIQLVRSTVRTNRHVADLDWHVLFHVELNEELKIKKKKAINLTRFCVDTLIVLTP